MDVFEKTLFSDFYESLVRFISLSGYTITGHDDELLLILANQEIERLRNEINSNVIPEGLKEFLKKRIAGNFLNTKYLTSTLGDNFEFEGAIKSLTEGEVKYDFDNNLSAEDRFRTLIDSMIRGDGVDILCYRKLKW